MPSILINSLELNSRAATTTAVGLRFIEPASLTHSNELSSSSGRPALWQGF